MMLNLDKSQALFLVIVVLLLNPATPCPKASACAIVSRDGSSVSTLNENVIIVFDPATNTQHFIRQAAFHSNAVDFGFLVPTPTKPELAEADSAVFDRLANAIKPERVQKRRWQLYATLYGACTAAADDIFTNVDSSIPTGSSGVEVLSEQTVAGYQAAVLRADDSEALLSWLKENGYEFKADLTDWVKPYIEKRWIITAFKYAKGSNVSASTLQTKAVRMSFAIDQPFFPYREPVWQTAKPVLGRSLKIFLVAPSRMSGSQEDSNFDWGILTETSYASQNLELGKILRGAIPQKSLPAGWWLTVIEDNSSRRPAGGDLYFTNSETQQQLVPPPIVYYSGFVRVPLFADVLLGIFLYLQLRKVIAPRPARRSSAYASRP